jgi:hypothetical protein
LIGKFHKKTFLRFFHTAQVILIVFGDHPVFLVKLYHCPALWVFSAPGLLITVFSSFPLFVVSHAPFRNVPAGTHRTGARCMMAHYYSTYTMHESGHTTRMRVAVFCAITAHNVILMY